MAAAVVTTAATTVDGDVKELGRRIVYSGPVLFDLTITFLVVRSFRQTKRVKLHRTSVISGKTTHRK
jgi:hypothetical protein